MVSPGKTPPNKATQNPSSGKDMSGLFGANKTPAPSGGTSQGDLSNDVEVANPPEDSISSIRFSPTTDHLAVASWDKKVRIYEYDQNGNTQGKALFEHEGPVLDCCWSQDGQKVFGAGADKAARMLDIGAGAAQAQQVAAHDQPIRCVEAITANGSPMLVTGSWDKTIKYWDLRQQAPVATVDVRERVYTMSQRNSELLVVGTADRWLHVIDLKNPTTLFRSFQSPLKWQTRTVSCFKDGTGFAIGSIEGRCAIQNAEDKNTTANFSFKCHRTPTPNVREQSDVFSLNSISFHPEHGTFSTAGSDGTFHFWDKDAKHRLKGYPDVGGTISTTDFNKNGTIFGYAVSYDWSKGYQHNTPKLANKIMLHPVQGDECKPRPNNGSRR